MFVVVSIARAGNKGSRVFAVDVSPRVGAPRLVCLQEKADEARSGVVLAVEKYSRGSLVAMGGVEEQWDARIRSSWFVVGGCGWRLAVLLVYYYTREPGGRAANAVQCGARARVHDRSRWRKRTVNLRAQTRKPKPGKERRCMREQWKRRVITVAKIFFQEGVEGGKRKDRKSVV